VLLAIGLSLAASDLHASAARSFRPRPSERASSARTATGACGTIQTRSSAEESYHARYRTNSLHEGPGDPLRRP
jgi:hypothetical protein